MSIQNIPNELAGEIAKHIVPTDYTILGGQLKAELKAFGRLYVNLSLVNTVFRDACAPDLEKIKSILIKYMVVTYHASPEANAQLLDAVTSGGPGYSLQRHSFSLFSADRESDIKDIVLLMPESLNYNSGTMRCRYHMHPLSMACANPNVPVHVVEFLLQHGANPHATYSFNAWDQMTALNDLSRIGINEERQAALKELLLQYGEK